MMRLDNALAVRGLCSTRSKAKEAILAGEVTVNGVICRKPSAAVEDGDAIALAGDEVTRYVSRGGRKLEAALAAFAISPTGKTALDIGASTGGFTDCLLQKGAHLVYAVDSGSSQLSDSLMQDGRVISMENTNARYLTRDMFPEVPSLAVMDVSFISQTLLHPAISAILPTGGCLVSLIKPQFEAGRAALSKKGVVRELRDREHAVARVIASAEACGLRCMGRMESPITGGDGNTEYLAYFIKEKSDSETGVTM